MANNEQLNILKQGVEEWNRWREEHLDEEIDLCSAAMGDAPITGADLTRADLTRADLTRANLTRANLEGADLTDANLEGANLEGANLRRVVINDTTQIDSKWKLVWELVNQGGKGRNLSGADLRNANLTRADLRGANLDGANLTRANLTHANLRRVVINDTTQIDSKWKLVWELVNQGGKGRNLSGVDLRGARLFQANLEDANLTRANLGGANLIGANLRGANLRGADLKDARLSHADLEGANLTRADLKDARLEDANLRGATLGGGSLFSANLFGANLEGANLQHANLRGANLERVNLCRANLFRANLSGRADLRGADLGEANLEGANLYGLKLGGANLEGANLGRANLYGASLIRANLSKAFLTGAHLYGVAYDDWKIDGILCDYVFWDDRFPFIIGGWNEGRHRVPKDRDFRPGEFEELYKQLPTFEYVFEHGFTPLDPLIMDQVVQAINERQPEIELKIAAFDARGTPHATFTVLHKDTVEDALKEVSAGYETRLKVLEGQKDQLMKVIAMLGSGGINIRDVEGGVTITAGGDIVGADKITTNVRGDVKQLAAGKEIEQKQE